MVEPLFDKNTRQSSLSLAGRIAFLPWVTVPTSVRIGRFRFCPVQVEELDKLVGPEIAKPATQAIQTHVDQRGRPIEQCTIILRSRHPIVWNITENSWRSVTEAAEILALACLAEQKFLMGHFSAHLNATMFRPVSMAVEVGSERIGLTVSRRGGNLRVGGYNFNEVKFQQPLQIMHTACEKIDIKLSTALRRAKLAKNTVWASISASLEFFLLAHSEMPELASDTCVMMSAMAFEKLLEEKGALSASRVFAELWQNYAKKSLADAKRIRPDPDPKMAPEQAAWPIHQKWMKELFEARNARAHGGPGPSSRNWAPWQHEIIAAFVYPRAVKLKLAAVGLYELTDKEIGGCEALDNLLDSDWGRRWRKAPEWSDILSKAESSREFSKIFRLALEQVKTGKTRIFKS